MSLRNNPYLPLYVQDFLTDEKLIECSASAHGIYIRLMCILHKSETYGMILLKQNDKQTIQQNDKQILYFARCFAKKLSKHMPFSEEEIFNGLIELNEQKVITIDDEKLYQKRMVKDGKLSEIRAKSGRKGAKAKDKKISEKFANDFAIAKVEANTENENETNIKENNNNILNIYSYYELNIHPLTSIELEKLNEWKKIFNDDLIKVAIDEAAFHNARSMAYINKILSTWKSKNITMVSDLQKVNNQFNNSNEIVDISVIDDTDWLNDESMGEDYENN